MIDEAVAAIRAGELVVLPTDTVYGLCGDAESEAAAREVAGLKGRSAQKPIALIAPNPKRRYPWLGGEDTIGVRVPDLPSAAAAVLDEVGAVLATSANLHGGPDPRRVDEIPEEIRRGAAVLVDAAELPGTPSTVLDLTSSEPRIVREGAVPAAEALSKARAAGASAGERT